MPAHRTLSLAAAAIIALVATDGGRIVANWIGAPAVAGEAAASATDAGVCAVVAVEAPIRVILPAMNQPRRETSAVSCTEDGGSRHLEPAPLVAKGEMAAL